MVLGEKMVRAVAGTHRMRVEASVCSRFRVPKSDCNACAALCPESVIELSENGPEIIGGCTDCGVCYSVCPNGVFMLEDRGDVTVLQEIREAVKDNNGEFRISCNRGDTESDLVLPCLSRLTESLLAGPALVGAASITLHVPPCGECPTHQAAPHFKSIVRNTRHLLRMLFPEEKIFIKSVPIKDFVQEPQEPVSRRAFFGAFRKRASSLVAGALPDLPVDKTERDDKPFHTVLKERPPNVKRLTLLNLLDGHSSVEQVEISKDESLMAEIEIGPECTGCDTCVTLCPTGAISRPIGDHYQLTFRSHLCVNCRVCENSCMPGALKAKESVLLNHLLKRDRRVIFESAKSICDMCQQEFLGSGSNICPMCVKSHNKNMAMVRSLLA